MPVPPTVLILSPVSSQVILMVTLERGYCCVHFTDKEITPGRQGSTATENSPPLQSIVGSTIKTWHHLGNSQEIMEDRSATRDWRWRIDHARWRETRPSGIDRLERVMLISDQVLGVLLNRCLQSSIVGAYEAQNEFFTKTILNGLLC